MLYNYTRHIHAFPIFSSQKIHAFPIKLHIFLHAFLIFMYNGAKKTLFYILPNHPFHHRIQILLIVFFPGDADGEDR